MFQFTDKKEKENNDFSLYEKFFDQCDLEEDESLYKKQLYVLEEDKFTKKDQSNLTLKHKALLDRLILEDFSVYPLKKDLLEIPENTKREDNSKKKINNEDKDSKKIDELEKFAEDENEFIKDLHRLNYITFSPFSLSFFNKGISSKDTYHNYTADKILKERENENKLFKMINFDYSNYEFNEELLFNICHGFVDIDKLKEDNIVGKKIGKSSIFFDSNYDFFKKSRDNSNSKVVDGRKENIKKEQIVNEEEEEKYNEDILINEINELNEEINAFIKKKVKTEFYKEEIRNYMKEKEKIDNMELSYEDKKNFYQKWINKFHEIEILYNNYRVQIERTETIKKVREEQKKKQIEEERIRKINEDNKFMEELNKIRDKALEKKFNEERGIISSNSSMYSDSNISNSSGFKGSSNNYSNLRGTMTSKMGSNNIKRDGQKKRTKKMERFDWMIKKNDNYFDQF